MNNDMLHFMVAAFLLSVSFASAASVDDITFPVAELGGCASEDECRTYCNDQSHWNECSAFAGNYGIITTVSCATV